MRVVFIGRVDASREILGKQLALPEAKVVGVVAPKSSPFDTGFRSHKPLVGNHGDH